LEVKPKIYSDGRIGMDIFVSDDEPELVSGLVAIRRREARTNMIVKDGETAVIGGILRSTDSNNRAGWPGLMNIPLVNFLFSSKSSANNVTELLTFITPLIVKRPPPAS
jgi:type IV pilus assembly protein PilQ